MGSRLLSASVWLADGRPAALRYGRMVVLWGLAAAAIVAIVVDVPAMLYQTLVVPLGHPWRFNDGPRVFVQTLRDLVPRAFVFAAIVGSYGLYRLWQIRGHLDVGGWVRANPWLVPVFAGMFFLPTSILGRMKIGGSLVALVYTIYFLFLGALLAALHLANHNPHFSRRVTGGRVSTCVVLVALVALVVQVAVQDLPLSTATEDRLTDPEASAYTFVRDHPGQVYLPLHPLIHLMAEKRAYHVLLPTISQQYFEHVTGEAELDASAADEEAFFSHLPSDLRYILFRVAPGTAVTPSVIQHGMFDHLRRYLPHFTRSVPVAPGWAALVADDAAGSGEPDR